MVTFAGTRGQGFSLPLGGYNLTQKTTRTSQVALVVKNPPAKAEDVKDMGSIPGSGKSPGGGNSNSFQYSCLENPMDRAAWRATVHRVARSRI